jgi:hypothetical protein
VEPASGRPDGSVCARYQEIEHAAVGQAESHLRPSPLELSQVQPIKWRDVTFRVESRPRGLIVDFGKVLVHGQVVADASQADASFVHVAFVCQLLNQPLHDSGFLRRTTPALHEEREMMTTMNDRGDDLSIGTIQHVFGSHESPVREGM